MSEFGKDLIEAAEESLAIARKKRAPAREVFVSIPDRVEVAPIRKRLDMTQAEFAATFGLNLKMVQKWERGQALSVAAKAYLTVIGRDPEAVRAALQSPGPEAKAARKPKENARRRSTPARKSRAAA